MDAVRAAREMTSREETAHLGDYIIPGIIGGSQPFIGQAVFQHQGTAGNIPLAAALTVVPVAIMALHLVLARRLGAFEAL
jgi:putative spermidine/putrescine transport system permease protein